MILELENSSKKRRWEEREDRENFENQSKVLKPVFNVDLHLEKPLPLEWQQCLDIKSGQIHFYNTRTQKRTIKDPRKSTESLSHGHMSLNLELNLSPSHGSNEDPEKNSGSEMKNSVSFEVDNREMVATVCMKCHMLVMLCKSSPLCPNCKFLHPPDQSLPSLFKPRLRLLCCKD